MVRLKNRQRILSLLSILSLMLAAVFFISALAFGLSKIGVIDISKLFGYGDSDNEILPGDGGRFADALRDNSSTDKVLMIADIPLSELSSLLANNPPAETYYISNSFVYYSRGITYSSSNRIWKDGENYRVETYQGTTLKQTVICDGSKVGITEGQSNDTHVFEINDSFNIESYASMPHPRDFLSRWDVNNLTITLLRTESDNLYQVSYKYPSMNQTELLYISIEYGLVVKAETYIGTDLVYSLSTEEITNSLDKFDVQTLFRIE